MKRRLGQTRVRFTPVMWDRWHADLALQDARTIQLREGIQTLRSLLASRDIVSEREWKLR